MPVKTEPFDVGDEVVFSSIFENAAGAPTNPTTLTLLIERPDGTEEAPILMGAMTNPVTGTWEKTYIVTQAGRYHFEFRGTGAIQLTKAGSTTVRESRFAYP